MKSKLKVVAKFGVIMMGAMLPVVVFGQGPLPPPPPEGIPFDLVSGVVLGGAALYNGTKLYLKRQTAV